MEFNLHDISLWVPKGKKAPKMPHFSYFSAFCHFFSLQTSPVPLLNEFYNGFHRYFESQIV